MQFQTKGVRAHTCRCVFSGLLAAVALGAVGEVYATHLNSFLDGWGSDGGPGNPTLGRSTNVGVTLHLYSLASTVPNDGSNFWGPSTGDLVGSGHLADFIQATSVSFDLTMDAGFLGGGGGFSGAAASDSLVVEIFAAPDGSTSLPAGANLFLAHNFAAAGLVDTSGQSGTWGGVDGTRTITYDLTQYTVVDGANTVTAAQFLSNHSDVTFKLKLDFVQSVSLGGGDSGGDGTAIFFWDNVRFNTPSGEVLIGNFEVLPEPAAFALLALGAPALFLVRRHGRRANSSDSF